MAQETILVDSIPGVVSLLDDLKSIPRNSSSLTTMPPLYCDLEGSNLGRHGSLAILTLYIPQAQKVYLVDVFTLQRAAFSSPTESGAGGSGTHSLQAVLEDSSIGKAFFDIRNDSDALYSHYGVAVAGIHDIQLMELASRSGLKRNVNGLARCIERDISAAFAPKADWLRAKQAGEKLWNPDIGGRYEVFNDRPLRPEIVKYCAQDVILLPELWKLYDGRLGRATALPMMWRDKIQRETIERIKLSQSPSYSGKGKHMALGPASFQ